MASIAIRQGAAALIAATAIALATALPAAAQEPVAAPGSANAGAALAAAEAALAPAEGPAGETEAAPLPEAPAASPDATVALNALAAALPELEGAERRQARGLLARPTDGPADRYGDGYPGGAPVGSAESPHFCVFWVNAPGYEDTPDLADADADGTPDYVEAILDIAEYSYAVEVSPGPLGWSPPKPDASGCGADPATRADIYLKQLGAQGLFGYESPDPGQGTVRKKYGYMVIDDDYAAAEYGFADPLDAAKVTFAHEFNHLLQQNYDSFQDVWLFESTATWSEDLVYPEVNDYVNYLSAFASTPGAPITDARAAKGLKIYASSVWNHWLTRPEASYGVAAVRRAWNVSAIAEPADFAIASYDRAIRDLGGVGFSHEFARFAAATAEWRTGFRGFPDAALYPDMKRKGVLSGRAGKEFELDHTALRLLRVDVRGGAGISLRVRAEDGVRSGLALVARQGDALSGTVTVERRYLPRGGSGSVTLARPGSFERITAVIVNSDGRVNGFDPSLPGGADWDYRKDDREFRARLTR